MGSRVDLYDYFFPKVQARINRLRSGDISLVHYTSAKAAHSIIENRAVYYRSVRNMNDSEEVVWGAKKLIDFFQSNDSVPFWVKIDELHPGSSIIIKNKFNSILPELIHNTYILCFTEHGKIDDEYGKLSMWRGYSAGTGVAITINPDVFYTENALIDAIAVPVSYEHPTQYFIDIVDSISNLNAKEFEFDQNKLVDDIVFYFELLCSSIKHPAFHEEKEWRSIFRPSSNYSNSFMQKFITLKSVPEQVYELKLKLYEDENEKYDLSISSLVKKILIGPCEHSNSLQQVFSMMLAHESVPSLHEVVARSGIPYRG